MPLHDGLPFEVEQIDVKDEELVWVVPETKEVSRDYEEYLLLRLEYNRRNWGNCYTLQGGLTYKEALQSEAAILPTLQQVPSELHGSILRIIQHSTLPFSQLSQRIHDWMYVEVSPDQEASELRHALHQQASQHPNLSLPSLRAFILKVSRFQEKLGVWCVKDSVAQGHELAQLTPELRRKFLKDKKQADERVIAPPPPPISMEAPQPPPPPAPMPPPAPGSPPATAGKAGRKRKADAPAVEAPQPPPATIPPAAAMPATGDVSDEGDDDEGQRPSGSRPRKRKKKIPLAGPPRTMEEEEKLVKEGTQKYYAFMALKNLGDKALEGLTLQEIVQQTIDQGVKPGGWTENSKRNLRHILASDITFALVSRGPNKYALRALPGVVPVPDEFKDAEGEGPAPATASPVSNRPSRASKSALAVIAPQPPPPSSAGAVVAQGTAPVSPRTTAVKISIAGAAPQPPVAGPPQPPPPPPGSEEALALAEAKVKEWSQKVEQLGKQVAQAQQKLEDARANMQAKEAQAAAPSSPAPEPEPVWQLPADVEEYKGDPNNRQELLEFNKKREEAIRKLAERKAEGEAEQRSKKSKASKDRKAARDKELLEARGQVAKMTVNFEKMKQACTMAQKAYEGHVRRLEAEKLRHAKQQDKVEREKVKAAALEEKKREAERREKEREQRRAEALAAKRYPIDDHDLMNELAAKAQEQGTTPPPSDVSLPLLPKDQPSAEAAALPLELAALGSWDAASSVLFAADFVSNFHKTLGSKAITAGELAALVITASPASAAADDKVSSGGLTKSVSGVFTVAASTVPASRAEAVASLNTLFASLLKFVLADIEDDTDEPAARLDKRWEAAMQLGGQGCWPEVVRRMMLSRSGALEGEAHGTLELDEAMRHTLSVLGNTELDVLSPGQHAALLRLLVDEATDTQAVRDAIASRQESCAEAVANKRSELAAVRHDLREILDAEKEQRKKAQEAKLARVQAKAAAAEAAQAASNAEGGAVAVKPEDAKPVDGNPETAEQNVAQKDTEGDTKAEVVAPTTKKPKKDKAVKPVSDAAIKDTDDKENKDSKETAGKEGKEGAVKAEDGASKAGAAVSVGVKSGAGEGAGKVAEGDDDDDDELVLPEELREFHGDPADKKAVAKFEAARDKKLRELERARDIRHREREEEAKKREKKKAELEERIASLTEAIEREVERATVRRAPLGYDRHFRRYWWGLAGLRSALLIEAPQQPQLQPGPGTSAHTTTAVAPASAAASGQPAAAANGTAVASTAAPSVTSPQQQGVAVQPNGAVIATHTSTPRLAAVVSTPAQLEALLTSLDVRGVRELDLKRAIEKVQGTMETAFKKAQATVNRIEAAAAAAVAASADEGSDAGAANMQRASKAGAAERAPSERQLPARSTRFQGTMDVGKLASAKETAATLPGRVSKDGSRATSEEAPGAQCIGGPFQSISLAAAVASLTKVAAAAGSAKVSAPGGGWKTYQQRLQWLLEGHVDPAWQSEAEQQMMDGEQLQVQAAADDDSTRKVSAVMQQLKLRLQECEHLVVAGTGEWDSLKRLEQEADVSSDSGSDEGEVGEGAAPMDVDGHEEKAVRKRRPGRAAAPHAARPDLLPDDAPELVVEEDEDPHDGIAISKRPRSVWYSVRERRSWVAGVQAACTSARLAYCAVVLEHLAMGPLEQVRKAAAKGGAKAEPLDADAGIAKGAAGPSKAAKVGKAGAKKATEDEEAEEEEEEAGRGRGKAASKGSRAGRGLANGRSRGSRRGRSPSPEPVSEEDEQESEAEGEESSEATPASEEQDELDELQDEEAENQRKGRAAAITRHAAAKETAPKSRRETRQAAAAASSKPAAAPARAMRGSTKPAEEAAAPASGRSTRSHAAPPGKGEQGSGSVKGGKPPARGSDKAVATDKGAKQGSGSKRGREASPPASGRATRQKAK